MILLCLPSFGVLAQKRPTPDKSNKSTQTSDKTSKSKQAQILNKTDKINQAQKTDKNNQSKQTHYPGFCQIIIKLGSF